MIVNMKKFYEQTIEEVYENLKTNAKGLSSEEAKTRLEMHGENILEISYGLMPLKNVEFLLIFIIQENVA